MGRWCNVIAKDAAWKDVWLKVWPAVVEATNAIYRPEDQGRLNVVVAEGDDENEPGDLDTLNTPVASLVDVFLKRVSRHGENGRIRTHSTVTRWVRCGMRSRLAKARRC